VCAVRTRNRVAIGHGAQQNGSELPAFGAVGRSRASAPTSRPRPVTGWCGRSGPRRCLRTPDMRHTALERIRAWAGGRAGSRCPGDRSARLRRISGARCRVWKPGALELNALSVGCNRSGVATMRGMVEEWSSRHHGPSSRDLDPRGGRRQWRQVDLVDRHICEPAMCLRRVIVAVVGASLLLSCSTNGGNTSPTTSTSPTTVPTTVVVTTTTARATATTAPSRATSGRCRQSLVSDPNCNVGPTVTEIPP
jgi:hypothetical protein